MKTIKTVTKNTLLAFVLISIGVVIGKNFSCRIVDFDEKKQSELPVDSGLFIDVYYFHSAFRCSTCNKIETMTKSLLESEFCKQLDAREIMFSDVNFQENEILAEEFQVVASCVVVAVKQNGRILKYRRLDEVWTLIDDPKEFNRYISEVIKNYLNFLP